jgi:hypothetical protein
MIVMMLVRSRNSTKEATGGVELANSVKFATAAAIAS